MMFVLIIASIYAYRINEMFKQYVSITKTPYFDIVHAYNIDCNIYKCNDFRTYNNKTNSCLTETGYYTSYDYGYNGSYYHYNIGDGYICYGNGTSYIYYNWLIFEHKYIRQCNYKQYFNQSVYTFNMLSLDKGEYIYSNSAYEGCYYDPDDVARVYCYNDNAINLVFLIFNTSSNASNILYKNDTVINYISNFITTNNTINNYISNFINITIMNYINNLINNTIYNSPIIINYINNTISYTIINLINNTIYNYISNPIIINNIINNTMIYIKNIINDYIISNMSNSVIDDITLTISGSLALIISSISMLISICSWICVCLVMKKK